MTVCGNAGRLAGCRAFEARGIERRSWVDRLDNGGLGMCGGSRARRRKAATASLGEFGRIRQGKS